MSSDLILEDGMSVFANKEMGMIRFIGETEFAPGIWLGVELRKPSKWAYWPTYITVFWIFLLVSYHDSNVGYQVARQI